MSARPYKVIVWKIRHPGFSEGNRGSRPLTIRSYKTAEARDAAANRLAVEGVEFLGGVLRPPGGIRIERYQERLDNEARIEDDKGNTTDPPGGDEGGEQHGSNTDP